MTLAAVACPWLHTSILKVTDSPGSTSPGLADLEIVILGPGVGEGATGSGSAVGPTVGTVVGGPAVGTSVGAGPAVGVKPSARLGGVAGWPNRIVRARNAAATT
jgi:hypothetical protein